MQSIDEREIMKELLTIREVSQSLKVPVGCRTDAPHQARKVSEIRTCRCAHMARNDAGELDCNPPIRPIHFSPAQNRLGGSTGETV